MSNRKPEPELRPDTRRIEAFSDAVFAIVLTIMVLEIRIPDVLAFGNDRPALEEFGALLAIYALSFVVVGILWANHHYIVFTLPHTDRTIVWLNNHVLFWVTLVPIVARFFGLHTTSPRAAAAYSFIILMCTLSLSLLRRHALLITRSELHRAIHRRVFPRALIAIALYSAAIPLAFVNMTLVWVLFLIPPALFFLPIVRREMQ